MSLSPEILAFLEGLRRQMLEAHRLGLYRTREKIHGALNEGRAEVWEVIPTTTGVVGVLTWGPVSTQP